MRVLMFGWEFPPHISGGLGTACFGLVQGLLRKNTDVLFVVPKLFGGEDKKFNLINVSDIRIDMRQTKYSEAWKKLSYLEVCSSLVPYTSPEEFSVQHDEYTQHRGQNESSPFSTYYELTGDYGKDLMKEVARYALVAGKIAEENEFDVIHAHDWLTYPAGIAAKNVSGKPLVIHVHATEFDRSGENINPDVFAIEKAGMDAADRIITVSDFTRDVVIHRYGIAPEKVVTVHNGVFPKPNGVAHHEKKKNKIVTFMGRITFQKGPEYFIAAAEKVLKKYPDVHFVMAGNGDMMHRMIREVAKKRISSRFHFTGFLRGEDVDRMFAMSDAYVMPSVSEPFGIAPLEAAQANVPVIISKQSGVSEVLKNAVKVDFWDTDAMAEAIIALLRLPSLSGTFREMSRQEVNGMSWDAAAEKVNTLYTKIQPQTTHP